MQKDAFKPVGREISQDLTELGVAKRIEIA